MKQEFLSIFDEFIVREGADQLREWLLKSDFFTAPASVKFHNAFEGGLVAHSVNVFNVMMEKHFDEQVDNPESFAICGLLHDVCKAQFYKPSTRNVKNETTGEWEKVPFYVIEEKFPFGHGEKSVFLLERFMRLKIDEAVAIRWHMGGFDDAVKGGSYAISGAYQKYPMAVKLHLSDIEAAYLVEGREE